MNVFTNAPKRNSSDKKVSGVCSGIARELKIDPFWVRIAALILLVTTVPFAILMYVAAAVLMEEDPAQISTPSSTSSKNHDKQQAENRASEAKEAVITKE